MNEELVNNYYDKILGFSEQYKNSKFIKKNKDEIKNHLRKIIELNNNHLLTDSILCYLSQDGYITYQLESFYSDSAWFHIAYLNLYYERLIIYFKNKNFSFRFIELLSNDTIEMINEACTYFDEIIKMDKFQTHFKEILYITLSYCHINNRLKEFNTIFSNILNNKELIMDDIDLNHLSDMDDLTIRVISMLNSINNKKLIK